MEMYKDVHTGEWIAESGGLMAIAETRVKCFKAILLLLRIERG